MRPEIDLTAFAATQSDGAFVVDVREPGEYVEGHVPGALAWAWNTQLCDTLRRDILSKEQFEALMDEFSPVRPEDDQSRLLIDDRAAGGHGG